MKVGHPHLMIIKRTIHSTGKEGKKKKEYIYGCIHQKPPAHTENFFKVDETFRVCRAFCADHFGNK
jgi:hypothetical protein